MTPHQVLKSGVEGAEEDACLAYSRERAVATWTSVMVHDCGGTSIAVWGADTIVVRVGRGAVHGRARKHVVDILEGDKVSWGSTAG